MGTEAHSPPLFLYPLIQRIKESHRTAVGVHESGLGTYEHNSVNVRDLVPEERMSLDELNREGHETSDVEQLRREVQQMVGENQAFFVVCHEEHAGRVQEGQRPVGVRQR